MIIGRVAAVLALAFGVVYLGWRVTSTLGGAPWWTGAPTLAVEAVGVVAMAATSWALWHRPETAAPLPSGSGSTPTPAPEPLDTEIVVRCTGQDVAVVRATLIACRPIAPVLIVDIHARPEVASLAVEHGVRYVATAPDDVDGLSIAARAVDAGAILLLDAGDVPHPSVLRSLLPWFDEPGIAVVQAPVEASDGESAEHGAPGRHDKQFERRALVPALGTRGLAAFTGSGALLRTVAVRSIPLVGSSTQVVQADLTSALFAAGWQIAAPGGRPLVAVAPIVSPTDVENVRACEASAARHLLLGDHGAWRVNHLSFPQRLSLMAQAVRPLAGVRRGIIVALLLGTLLSGRLPFDAELPGFIALWAPWFALSAVALWLLSGRELRPGDRVRWSMRMLGASWRGLAAIDGRPDPANNVLGSAFGLHHGVASAGAVASISVVIGMRAVSDRITHTLAHMPIDETAAVLVVALWSLCGGLDALRILARRAQTRRATRIVASLPSTFADRSALVVDLTPLGAGVLSDADLAIGSEQRVDIVLPTASGVISAAVPVVVRNVRIDFSGERRFGVEFGQLESYVADALTEYCVVQPALELLGGTAVDPTLIGARPVVVLDDHAALPRRMGLRAAALLAVAGAMASAVPTAEASAPGGRVEGVVSVAAIDSTGSTDDVAVVEPMLPGTTVSSPIATTPAIGPSPTLDIATTVPTATVATASAPEGGGDATGSVAAGTMITVVCSLEAGADGSWGTSDDVYGAPVSTAVGDDGAWALDLDGTACWASIAPPVGLMVSGETGALESPTALHPIDLRSGIVPRVELVRVAGTTSSTAGLQGTDGPVSAAAVLVDDVVWADLDADGVLDVGENRIADVTVTLIGADGEMVGSQRTDDDGGFSFEGTARVAYRLAVSNLPSGLVAPDMFGMSPAFELVEGGDINLAIGLRPATSTDATSTDAISTDVPTAAAGDSGTVGDATTGGTGSTTVRLLAQPSSSSLASEPAESSPFAGWLVVIFATLIGVSVLAGSLRPGRNSFAPSVPRLG